MSSKNLTLFIFIFGYNESMWIIETWKQYSKIATLWAAWFSLLTGSVTAAKIAAYSALSRAWFHALQTQKTKSKLASNLNKSNNWAKVKSVPKRNVAAAA